MQLFRLRGALLRGRTTLAHRLHVTEGKCGVLTCRKTLQDGGAERHLQTRLMVVPLHMQKNYTSPRGNKKICHQVGLVVLFMDRCNMHIDQSNMSSTGPVQWVAFTPHLLPLLNLCRAASPDSPKAPKPLVSSIWSPK